MVRFRSSRLRTKILDSTGMATNGFSGNGLPGPRDFFSPEIFAIGRERLILCDALGRLVSGRFGCRALRLKDGDLYKVHRVGANGAHDRMPSHASFLVQDEVSKAFSAQVVDQPDFQWQ
jgi:hypothetical protein